MGRPAVARASRGGPDENATIEIITITVVVIIKINLIYVYLY